MQTQGAFTFSGERLRQARLRKGWTQDQLARSIGTRERNIIKWEKGQNVPRAETVAALARSLGCEIEFFYIEGEPDDDAEEAAMRRRARDLLSQLNPSMVEALLAEARASGQSAREGART